MSGSDIGKRMAPVFFIIVIPALLLTACGKRTQPETAPPQPQARESMEDVVESQPSVAVKQKNNLLLQSGVTLTASSRNQETESVSSLIDGKDDSIWHVEIAAIGAPAWVMVDFGEGNSRTVKRLAAQPRKDIPSQFFHFSELFGSDDGVNWEKVASIVQEEVPRSNAWREWTFDNPRAYRFYRLNILDGYGADFHNQFLSMAGLGLFE
jgi:F5/8 type C domain